MIAMMDPETWKAMTKREQATHLLGAEMTTDRQQHANANDPVGDVGVVTYWRAIAGGVAVSSWRRNPDDAKAAGRRSIERFAAPEMCCPNCGWEGYYDEVIEDENEVLGGRTMLVDVCPECKFISPEDLQD